MFSPLCFFLFNQLANIPTKTSPFTVLIRVNRRGPMYFVWTKMWIWPLVHFDILIYIFPFNLQSSLSWRSLPMRMHIHLVICIHCTSCLESLPQFQITRHWSLVIGLNNYHWHYYTVHYVSRTLWVWAQQMLGINPKQSILCNAHHYSPPMA
jgi:hypothetical protein